MLLDYWMLPILFILHDFEEMIMMPIWKRRHNQPLRKMKKPFFGAVTNGQAFSVGVLEELIILIGVSLVSSVLHSDRLYLAFMVTYTLHFLMHYRMCFEFRGYVPGVISATLELPVMIGVIMTYWQRSQSTFGEFWGYVTVAFLIQFVNLRVMHTLMPKIQAKMAAYTRTPLL